MCHIFFIHSSVDGHLGCFHVLAIVNRAAMNIVVHNFLNYGFSQGICLVVGLLGRMVVLFLVFWGTFILFSIVAVSIYIPTNSARGFPFLHTLSSIYCLTTVFWFLQNWSYPTLEKHLTSDSPINTCYNYFLNPYFKAQDFLPQNDTKSNFLWSLPGGAANLWNAHWGFLFSNWAF